MWTPHCHAAHHHHDAAGPSPPAAGKWAPELSSLSNVIIFCCAKILSISVEDLQNEFEKKALVSSKASQKYDLNLLEYCCFKALDTLTQHANFLKDKQFRHLSFEMMVAWEAPDSVALCFKKLQTTKDEQEGKDDIATRFSHSRLIPLLVHQKSTVGRKAFMRIAPAISGVADVFSAEFQFNALASPTGGRLPFRVYDRYLKELDKALDNSRNQTKYFNGDKFEVVVELEDTLASSLVIHCIGASTQPGRLILTSSHLCFEPVGVTSYDTCRRWDLASDLQQLVEPYASGPRIVPFLDRVLSYKSRDDYAIFEFPGLFGCSRRDYWLMIIQEIIYAHQFIRKASLDGYGLMEAISRSVMGILRLKATREALCANPAQPKLLLCFSMAHEITCGNVLLKILEDKLIKRVLRDPKQAAVLEGSVRYAKSASRVLFSTVDKLPNSRRQCNEMNLRSGDFFFNETQHVRRVIEQSCPGWEEANVSELLVIEDKADSLSINIALIKAVVSSLQPAFLCINALLSWDDPWKTISVILLGSSIIMRDLVQYVASFLFAGMAIFLLSFKQAGDGPLCGVIDLSCPKQSNDRELLELQQALSGLEKLLRTSNIILLKIRALLYSVCPQATDYVILALIILAVLLTVLPAKILLLLLFLELFTRRLPLRQENSTYYMSRLKHWWFHIPTAPIYFRNEKDMGERWMNRLYGRTG